MNGSLYTLFYLSFLAWPGQQLKKTGGICDYVVCDENKGILKPPCGYISWAPTRDRASMSYRPQRADAPSSFANFFKPVQDLVSYIPRIPEFLGIWRADVRKQTRGENESDADRHKALVDLALRKELDETVPYDLKYLYTNRRRKCFAISHNEKLVVLGTQCNLMLFPQNGLHEYGDDSEHVMHGHHLMHDECTCSNLQGDYYYVERDEDCPVRGHHGIVRCMAFSEDDTMLYTHSSYFYDDTVDDFFIAELNTWGITELGDGRWTLTLLKSVALHEPDPNRIEWWDSAWQFGSIQAFSPDGRFLAAGQPPALGIIHTETLVRDHIFFREDIRNENTYLEKHMTFSADSRLLAYSRSTGLIMVVKSENCELVHIIHLFPNRLLKDMAFSPDSKTLACCTITFGDNFTFGDTPIRRIIDFQDGFVELWNIGRAKERNVSELSEKSGYFKEKKYVNFERDVPYGIAYDPNDPTRLILATVRNDPDRSPDWWSHRYISKCERLNARTLEPIIGVSETQVKVPGYAYSWDYNSSTNITVSRNHFSFSSKGAFAVLGNHETLIFYRLSQKKLGFLRKCFRTLLTNHKHFRWGDIEELPPEILDMMAERAYPNAW